MGSLSELIGVFIYGIIVRTYWMTLVCKKQVFSRPGSYFIYALFVPLGKGEERREGKNKGSEGS